LLALRKLLEQEGLARLYTLLKDLEIVRLAMTATAAAPRAGSGPSTAESRAESTDGVDAGNGPDSATQAREALAGSPLLAALKRYCGARLLTHDQVVSPPERLAALQEGAETAGFLGALEAARRIGQQIEAGRAAREATHALLQAWGLPTLHDSFKTLGLI